MLDVLKNLVIQKSCCPEVFFLSGYLFFIGMPFHKFINILNTVSAFVDFFVLWKNHFFVEDIIVGFHLLKDEDYEVSKRSVY